jgi:hypothetical protein
MAFFRLLVLKSHGHRMLKYTGFFGHRRIKGRGKSGRPTLTVKPLAIQLFIEIEVETFSIKRIPMFDIRC